MIEKAIYIGDKNTFAIRYMPDYSLQMENQKFQSHYAYCHFVLGGNIIGFQDEICYLSTWKYAFEYYIHLIKHNFKSISSPLFNNKTDEEIWELLCMMHRKSKGLSFKQNSKIALLLNNIELSVLESLHYTCILSIDETTDRFISYLISVDDEIIYVWKKHKGRKLGSIKVKRTFVIETMEACIQQIESDYPHLAYSGKIS